MIELPLTPYFFQKLGLYQELTDKDLVVDKSLWKMERKLLEWTVKHHQHLASTLNRFYIAERLVEFGFSKLVAEGSASKVMGNLCQRGYASPVKIEWIDQRGSFGMIKNQVKKSASITIDSPDEIVFTQKGLAAGEVLKEVGDGRWSKGRWKYRIFIGALWFSIIVLFSTAIIFPAWEKIVFPGFTYLKEVLTIIPTQAPGIMPLTTPTNTSTQVPTSISTPELTLTPFPSNIPNP